MGLGDEIRARVLLVGGKVTGVDCPACSFESRSVEPDPFDSSDLVCPDCGRTILTGEQKRQLQRANKL